jgi:hypothetical protein
LKFVLNEWANNFAEENWVFEVDESIEFMAALLIVYFPLFIVGVGLP